MIMLSALVAASLIAPTRDCAAQTPQTPQKPQIDCSWLTVDSMAKTVTLQLTAGLTQLNGGLNFNGFNDGKLTLNVPANWTVLIRFTNHDQNLPHSVEVIDSLKPIPAGPVDPAFSRAMTVRLMQGLGGGESDSLRFVANKPGSYLIFCAVPGHGLAGMWLRLKVSPAEKRPSLVASGAS
jgi:sulfocyanin